MCTGVGDITLNVVTGIILRSQLANFSQFWSKFCHPWDQCKSGEKRCNLYAGGFWQAFLLDCLFSTDSLWSCHFSRIFARPEWSLCTVPCQWIKKTHLGSSLFRWVMSYPPNSRDFKLLLSHLHVQLDFYRYSTLATIPNWYLRRPPSRL